MAHYTPLAAATKQLKTYRQQPIINFPAYEEYSLFRYAFKLTEVDKEWIEAPEPPNSTVNGGLLTKDQ